MVLTRASYDIGTLRGTGRILSMAVAYALVTILALDDGGCKKSETAPSPQPAPRSVSIAAAANVAVALDAVAAEFQKQHPEMKIEITYGSSWLLFGELQKRAPYDIYMSADYEFPRLLVDEGLAVKGSEFRYARGTLAVWASNSAPVNVESLGVQALLSPAIKQIAISDPAHTPYGRASEAALKALGVYEQVQSKLMPCQDTAQAARLVDTGIADLALIGTPLASSLSAKGQGRYWQVPLESYPAIVEAGVVMTWAKDSEASNAVRDYIASADGRAIFQRLGFILPF